MKPLFFSGIFVVFILLKKRQNHGLGMLETLIFSSQKKIQHISIKCKFWGSVFKPGTTSDSVNNKNNSNSGLHTGLNHQIILNS